MRDVVFLIYSQREDRVTDRRDEIANDDIVGERGGS